eukprot:scaffold14029_cov121-Isochrysis_galbana.AAC.2
MLRAGELRDCAEACMRTSHKTGAGDGERQKRHRRSVGQAGRRRRPARRPLTLRAPPPSAPPQHITSAQDPDPDPSSRQPADSESPPYAHMLAFATRHFCGDDVDTTRIFCLLPFAICDEK